MSGMANIEVKVSGSERVVSVSAGQLNDAQSDSSLSQRLTQLLSPAPVDSDSTEFHTVESFETLTLDFETITWLSSEGLNELIAINRQVRTHGVRLVLANVQEPVRRVFALTRLERMFELAEPQTL